LTALAILLPGACTENEPSPRARGSRSAPTIVIDTRGGDSFAPTQRVTGRSECTGVTLAVNGAPIDAPVELNEMGFVAEVPLHEGDNEVVALCATENGTTRSNQVRFHQRLSDGPKASIQVDVRGATVIMDARESKPSSIDGAGITDYVWTPAERNVMLEGKNSLELVGGQKFERAEGERIRLRAPTRDGEYFAALEITDAEGRTDTSITYLVVERGRARAVDLMHEHPNWVDDAIVYAPIPALWGDGGPKAVQNRLPYLKELGVNTLWLWPPTSLRASGEEYAITDYFEVDPSWGPEKALRDLVDRAHELGMHVLVDFVPNHLSAEASYFQDAEKHGELSPYWSFFDRKEGEATYYFDWNHLPNLNFDDPEVRKMVIEGSKHWVQEIGVDGFRMDVAWGVKRRGPDFWPQWRRELKRINPDLLLLAEASAIDPYYFSNGFDAAYDWTRELGRWAWARAFERPKKAGVRLESAITNKDKGYSEDALILRFLNNNDTGTRFVERHGPRMTKVAATQQFTLPGIPALFAGDEIGAGYEPYSNLTPIPWKDRHKLTPHYERLIELRRTIPALVSAGVQVLETDRDGVLAYLRPGAASEDSVLVVLNYGTRTQVQIGMTPRLTALLSESASLDDLLNGGEVKLMRQAGAISLSLRSESAAVLMRGKE
jgi:cyclomaltodextrinase / maltogenic alpha-amylase / neopullulanase